MQADNIRYVTDFATLMHRHASGTIHSLMDSRPVRELRVEGDTCHIRAADGTMLTVPLSTPITYEPWVFDRGSMLFRVDGIVDALKICTEYDLISFEDGEISSIQPPMNCVDHIGHVGEA